jgi:hypothetical protein
MSLITVLILALATQQAITASIEGTVLQSGTAQPIANAVVELSGAGARSSLVISTGADGKFEFRNLAAGPYNLKVSRNGYLENSRGRSISVTPGQAVKEVRLAMMPLGALSGRVYDSTGEPVVNVSVRALKYTFQGGRRTLTVVKTDTTDDRGEFRLFWLPPGQYYVSAVPAGRGPLGDMHISIGRTEMRLDADGGNPIAPGYAVDKLGTRYLPVYYPGTTDPQAASPVNVQPGSDFNGVYFALQRVTPRKVRAIAIDAALGKPARTPSVTLVPRGTSSITVSAARPASDGVAEFESVFPGNYYAVATSRIVSSAGEVRLVGGRAAVDVDNSDVDRVVVVMFPPVDISGQVTVDGVLDNAAGLHPIVALINEHHRGPDLGAAFRELFASFDTPERFTINDAVEGDYRVEVTDLPPGTYLKSIRFGAADLADAILHIDPRSADRLEIVLGTNVGSLEGVVTDKDRRPLGNTSVALVPDTALRQRIDLYQSATTDESGRFRLQGIAPGDYLLFAWEEIEDGLWLDPTFIQRNATTGRRIRVSERSRENVELVAIPFAY